MNLHEVSDISKYVLSPIAGQMLTGLEICSELTEMKTLWGDYGHGGLLVPQ
jgi:hypothetical protein